jgi:hypothetical protein
MEGINTVDLMRLKHGEVNLGVGHLGVLVSGLGEIVGAACSASLLVHRCGIRAERYRHSAPGVSFPRP